jgi:hypothetical protein
MNIYLFMILKTVPKVFINDSHVFFCPLRVGFFLPIKYYNL